jgi:competence protein ComEC
MARPLLLLAAAFALGSLLGTDLGARGVTVLLGLCGLVLATAQFRFSAWSTAGVVAAAVGLGAAGAGVEVLAYERQPLKAWLERDDDPTVPRLIEGVVQGDARDAGDRFSLVVDTAGGQVPAGRLRIEIGGLAPRAEILDGDRVRLFATLGRPRGFQNPGAFDVLAAARHNGIVGTGYCKSPLLVRVRGRGEVGLLRDLAARGRSASRAVFRKWMVPGPEEGLVRAMVLGDRTGVAPDTAEAFRAAGTFHVLALSGTQVALLAGLLVAALRLAHASPLTIAVSTSLGVGFYSMFVGGDVPVVRAALMTIVVVAGKALDLDADLANLLGLAALLLLAYRPSNIADVGFQLSFGATLGLILLTGRFLEWLPRLPLRIDAAFAGSLAAQAALVPLLAVHFHRVTPAALVLNLVAVPLSGGVLLSGLALLAVSWNPLLASWASLVAWAFAHALLRSSEPAGWLPGLDPRVATPTIVAVLVYAAGVASLLRRGNRAKTLLLGGTGLLLMLAPRTAVGDGRLRLTVLDVGQGDGLVLRSPKGRVRLVDAGGSYDSRFDVGEAVVAPYLWSLGIARLDGILATHAHPDHVGGIPAILRDFRVREVAEGPAPGRDRVYEALDAFLASAKTSRRSVARGVSEVWDGVRLRVLGPTQEGPPPWRTRNDDSVVLEVAYGDVRFLLTGDIEAQGESRLQAGTAQVVKVPHHGSRTSSSAGFVRAVAPRVALVSAGFRNRFGHPDPGVVARYRQWGMVLSTAEQGALTVSTDGRHIWVETYEGVHEERLRR